MKLIKIFKINLIYKQGKLTRVLNNNFNEKLTKKQELKAKQNKNIINI